MLACLGLLPALSAPLAAQGARGTATTTVRYVALRPVVLDTVARSEVTDEGGGRFTFEGRQVFCLADRCTFYRSRDVEHGVVATQDISATAWGLGVRGLSATLLVRGRADLAGDFSWPTAVDAFDAILAYAQLQRSSWRVRAGRQRTLSGLGFAGFDGLDVLYEPSRGLRAELYGGRSLARGLNEPRDDALRGVEDFVPDRTAFLIGGFVEAGPVEGTAIGLRYQREILSDRSVLLSERAALDLRSDLPGTLRLDASADYDFAFGRVGKAHLTLRSELPGGWGGAEITARRYLPYFELWTIWGFFSPVAYHEAEVKATVRRWAPLVAWASAGYRAYEEANAPTLGESIRDRSQRYGVGARLARGDWAGSVDYRLETGFGAFLSSGDVEVRWTPVRFLALTARGTAFQQIEEFRLGETVVLGAGVGAEVELPRRMVLRAGIDAYDQAYENRSSATDWSQVRAHTILAVPFGADPGRGNR